MMKRSRRLNFFLLGVTFLALLFGVYLLVKKSQADPKERYLTETVERGSIRRVVSSTGTIQAVVTVQVGSQVSGRIQELYADFNSVVKKGQVLAVIDPANFEAQLQRAQAGLATALAAVKNAEASLNSRKADLSSAKANLEVARVAEKDAQIQLKRTQGLFQEGLVSQRDLDLAQVAYDQGLARFQQAEAQVTQSEANVRSALAQQDQAAANVKQAQAELKMAEVNLQYTNIISPIDGVVIERSVDIGQTVAASFQAPILFLLANDLTKMQVIAQIDEADIGGISEKAKADFTVDAFPGQTFHGKISEIRLSSKLPASSGVTTPSGTASNVVVYNVIIDVDNPQLKLRPNMTANVNFTVTGIDNVLHIANAALRYRPPDSKLAATQKLPSSVPSSALADTRQSAQSPPTPQDRQTHSSVRGDANPGGRPVSMTSDSRTPSSGNWPGRDGGSHAYMRQRASSGGAMATIGPSQTDVYGIHAGMKIRFPTAEEAKPVWGTIWVLNSKGQPEARRIKLGITDGRETAVPEGDLNEGETVITGEISDESGSQQRSASPFRSPFAGSAGTRRGGR